VGLVTSQWAKNGKIEHLSKKCNLLFDNHTFINFLGIYQLLIYQKKCLKSPEEPKNAFKNTTFLSPTAKTLSIMLEYE